MKVNRLLAPTRLSTLAILCLLAVTMLSACGERGPTEAEVDRQVELTEDLFQYIPDQEYASLGFTNVNNLIDNPWAQELFELYPALRVWDNKLGVGIDRFDQFAIAVEQFDPAAAEPDILIIMRSDLSEKEVLALIGERKRFFDEDKVGKRVQYTSGEEFSFGIINDTTVALGTPHMVRRSLEVANGERDSLVNGTFIDRFKPYFQKNDDFWLGIKGIDKYLQQSQGISFLRGLQTIDFAYFGLSAHNGVSSQFIGEAEDAESAGKISRSLGMIKGVTKTLSEGIIQYQDKAEFSGISPRELKDMFDNFIDNIEITSEGKQVIIRFVFPDELLDFFLELSKEAIDESDLQGQPTDGIDNPR